MILAEARPVEGPEERLKALEAFTERLVPGRWDEVRPPTAQELKGTRVLALTLDEASAKVRTGPPVDDDEYYELDVWAGVVPLAIQAGALTPDPKLTPGIEPSEPVRRWADERSGASAAAGDDAGSRLLQQRVELLALGVRKRGERHVLGGGERELGLGETLVAGGGDRDQVPPAVLS